jgi:putative transcriptional regulator
MINKVRAARLDHEMTQVELAKRLGVSRQTIISVENGKYLPSIVLAIRLAKVFDRHVEDLFQLESSD